MTIVDEINDYTFSLSHKKLSTTIVQTAYAKQMMITLLLRSYMTEFFNTINCSGIPPHNPSDSKIPFKMNRRQFPIIISFAMTINKSRGQSLNNVGIYLPTPVFSHGQLYVALSKAKSLDGLWVLILDNRS